MPTATYKGDRPDGVDLADPQLHFPPGESVEVSDEVAKRLPPDQFDISKTKTTKTPSGKEG